MKEQTVMRRLAILILGICLLFSAAAAEIAIDQPPVYINLTWDEQSNGPDLDISAYVTGILDDGSEVIRAETEGEYLSSTDFSWVGSHYIYGNGLTKLAFHRLDGDYSIIVEWGNPDILFSGISYADVNLNIEISTSEEILANISANMDRATAEGRENIVPVDDFYYRGGTGVWYLGFRLDHGRIVPLFSEDNASEPAPEAQPDIQYVQDIQSQSVEAYNDAGFKTASEWHENGVVTAYTYWDYDENNRLVQIRYANMMDPDEVIVLFTYENGSVQMYNVLGTLLAEAESAYAAAEQLGMGYIVAESGVSQS